jgi:hypothetical protein
MIFFATIALCSCQPALVNFPDCPPVAKLEMPPPIPDNMKIDIEEGRIVKIDDNGANHIRFYHDLRKAIKDQ